MPLSWEIIDVLLLFVCVGPLSSGKILLRIVSLTTTGRRSFKETTTGLNKEQPSGATTTQEWVNSSRDSDWNCCCCLGGGGGSLCVILSKGRSPSRDKLIAKVSIATHHLLRYSMRLLEHKLAVTWLSILLYVAQQYHSNCRKQGGREREYRTRFKSIMQEVALGRGRGPAWDLEVSIVLFRMGNWKWRRGLQTERGKEKVINFVGSESE